MCYLILFIHGFEAKITKEALLEQLREDEERKEALEEKVKSIYVSLGV